MPPLQLIEHEWGGMKDRSTNKSHLEEARAEQARTRSAVVQEEKKVKKAEKALEAKVS
jgi:structural maintenance of chromosome 1